VIKNILFYMSSRPALVSTQPPIQWVQGALSTGVNSKGVNLTGYFQLVPRSRKYGPMHPLPHAPSWRSAYSLAQGQLYLYLKLPLTDQMVWKVRSKKEMISQTPLCPPTTAPYQDPLMHWTAGTEEAKLQWMHLGRPSNKTRERKNARNLNENLWVLKYKSTFYTIYFSVKMFVFRSSNYWGHAVA
jgi:hypothetical protein